MPSLRSYGMFEFHRVGQGLFYSGKIDLWSSMYTYFNFVYDCGGSDINRVNQEVHRYRNKGSSSSNSLDMLVLSHFHKDHISGLDELLKSFRKIEYVFLPYLLPIERLTLALMYPAMPSWYYEFLHDPVAYLLERKVGKVILISPGKGWEGGTPPEPIQPRPPDEGREGEIPPESIQPRPPDEKRREEDRLLIELMDDPEAEQIIIKHEGTGYKSYINKGRLLVKAHDGHVIALGIWVFRFFNYKLGADSLNKFAACIQTIMGNINLKAAIKDKWQRRQLRNCYEKIRQSLNKDFNNTSLIMYHVPVGNYKTFITRTLCRWYCEEYKEYRRYPCLNRRFGQFLTGDIDLNYRYKEIWQHFRHYFHHTFLVQIPHHGALHNWCDRILRDVPPSLWVTSAGIRNRYGHPHIQVVLDILHYYHHGCLWGLCCPWCLCRFVWSNENNEVIIEGRIEW